jgi:hypothetical protein
VHSEAGRTEFTLLRMYALLLCQYISVPSRLCSHPRYGAPISGLQTAAVLHQCTACDARAFVVCCALLVA